MIPRGPNTCLASRLLILSAKEDNTNNTNKTNKTSSARFVRALWYVRLREYFLGLCANAGILRFFFVFCVFLAMDFAGP